MSIKLLTKILPCVSKYHFCFFSCQKQLLIDHAIILNDDESYNKHLMLILEYWKTAMMKRFKIKDAKHLQSIFNMKINEQDEKIQKWKNYFVDCVNIKAALQSVSQYRFDTNLFDRIYWLFFSFSEYHCIGKNCSSDYYVGYWSDENEYCFESTMGITFLCCEKCARQNLISRYQVTSRTCFPSKLLSIAPCDSSKYPVAIKYISCFAYGGPSNMECMQTHNNHLQEKKKRNREQRDLVTPSIEFLKSQMSTKDFLKIVNKLIVMSDEERREKIEQYRSQQ